MCTGGDDMRRLVLVLLVLSIASLSAKGQGFGVCKPVVQRSTQIGCWILVDEPIGRAPGADLYWHLDRYRDSAQATRAKGAHDVVFRALGTTWLMSFDTSRVRSTRQGTHVADIGPLRVTPGREYTAVFMEAITMPGMTSAVHRHSGPEAWYTVAGETCLETPGGRIVGRVGHPAIVPEGPPMFLTAIGTHQRRAITLILHDTDKPPTTMETKWKPKGLCR